VVEVYKRVFLLSIIIFGTLFASAQQDQRLRDRDPDLDAAKALWASLQQANFHAGPFYWSSRLRISDAGFTETGYLPTGDQSGGLSLTVEAPNRFYFVPRKKVIFTADVNPSYSFFTEGERGRQFNYSVRGDMHLLLNHLYLDVYALRADQLRAHVADINRLATAREDEFGVGGEFKYSSRTSALFSVRLRETAYPRDRFQPDPDPEHIPIEVLDREERNGRVALHHKTFPRTSLFVAGERSDYTFPNKADYASDRTYVGAGFLFDAGRTQVRLEAGPTRLQFDDPSQPDYQGVTGNLRVTRGNGRWSYYFNGGRDLGFSIFVNNPYYIATTAAVGVDHVTTRRLTLHARSVYERDEYDHPVLTQTRTDDISFTSAGFTYAIRRARVGADIGWYERDSTAFGDKDSGIRYVLRLSFTP
jgi:Putative beta-barrel porin 2